MSFALATLCLCRGSPLPRALLLHIAFQIAAVAAWDVAADATGAALCLEADDLHSALQLGVDSSSRERVSFSRSPTSETQGVVPSIQFVKEPAAFTGVCKGTYTNRVMENELVMSHNNGTLCMAGYGFETRVDSTGEMIRLAVNALYAKGKQLPEFRHFCVHTEDMGNHSCNLAYAEDPAPLVELKAMAERNSSVTQWRSRLIPDFTFLRWPEAGFLPDFASVSARVRELGKKSPSTSLCGWAGNANGIDQREFMMKSASTSPELLEIRDVYRAPGKKITGDHLTIEDQISRWACMIDVQGQGFSGRVPLLLHSGRSLLLIERSEGVPTDNVWYTHKLVAWEHYIPVSFDLHDLQERARWVQEHGKEAERIAANAQQFAEQYLTLEYATQFLAEQLFAATTEQASANANGFNTAEEFAEISAMAEWKEFLHNVEEKTEKKKVEAKARLQRAIRKAQAQRALKKAEGEAAAARKAVQRADARRERAKDAYGAAVHATVVAETVAAEQDTAQVAAKANMTLATEDNLAAQIALNETLARNLEAKEALDKIVAELHEQKKVVDHAKKALGDKSSVDVSAKKTLEKAIKSHALAEKDAAASTLLDEKAQKLVEDVVVQSTQAEVAAREAADSKMAAEAAVKRATDRKSESALAGKSSGGDGA